MSGKRFNPLEDPPTASSSDEDEVETEGEEIEANSSSEEEEEEEDDVSSKTPAAVKKPVTVLAATTEKQVSDSESGSEEETESDSEPEKKDQVVTSPVKPVITEINDSVVNKNQDSKKVKTSEKSVGKRSRETDEGVSTDVKRAKKVSGEEEKKSGGGEETKKTYFQRVWSEDDEIAVLQGLIDYKNDTRVSPYEDMNGFYQLVKKTISFDVTKTQFTEKLRGLKKKYENNVGKAKNGQEPTFVKPHDRKTFELSKFIWGASGMALESVVKSNGKPKKSRKSKKLESVKQELDSFLPNGKNGNGKNCEDEVTVKGEVSLLGASDIDTLAKSSLVKSLARFGVDELAAQQGLSTLASEDKKRFEEQWKALQVKELEFYSQKSGFLYEVVTKIAEAFRSNR